MGGIEIPKELDVRILSLKAKPVGVIGKEVGTTSTAEFVLVWFDALGNDNTLC